MFNSARSSSISGAANRRSGVGNEPKMASVQPKNFIFSPQLWRQVGLVLGCPLSPSRAGKLDVVLAGQRDAMSPHQGNQRILDDVRGRLARADHAGRDPGPGGDQPSRAYRYLHTRATAARAAAARIELSI